MMTWTLFCIILLPTEGQRTLPCTVLLVGTALVVWCPRGSSPHDQISDSHLACRLHWKQLVAENFWCSAERSLCHSQGKVCLFGFSFSTHVICSVADGLKASTEGKSDTIYDKKDEALSRGAHGKWLYKYPLCLVLFLFSLAMYSKIFREFPVDAGAQPSVALMFYHCSPRIWQKQSLMSAEHYCNPHSSVHWHAQKVL